MGGIQENTILAALKFAEYAYKKDSLFCGAVCFNIQDATGPHIMRTIYVPGNGADIQIFEGRPENVTINCTVKAGMTVLLAILTGALDASTAFLWGQLFVDDITVMGEFTKAFDFSREKFVEFQQSLSDTVESTSGDTESTSGDTAESTFGDTAESPSGDTEKILKNVVDSPTGISEMEPEKILVLEQFQPNRVVPNTIRKKPLKQTLAMKGLDLIVALRNISKEMDNLMVRVKEKEKVKNALAELDEKTDEFKATTMYRQIQSNAVYVTLRSELERASIGASMLGQKAKGIGKDVVVKLATIAYPQNFTENDNTSITNNENNNVPGINNNDNNSSNASIDDVQIVVSNPVTQLSKAEIAAVKKEEKRRQLQEKLGQLKSYNKELGEQRKQRLAGTQVIVQVSK